MREDEQLSIEKVKSYELVLSGIQPEVLGAAMKKLAGTCVFFPTAAEVREACERESHLRIMTAESKRILKLTAAKPTEPEEAAERERLRLEFQQMLADSKDKNRMSG